MPVSPVMSQARRRALAGASLLAAEAGARTAGLGLWADPYYAVIAAADRPSFAEKAGTAVIVEGRITGIADRRPRIMLYFRATPGLGFFGRDLSTQAAKHSKRLMQQWPP